MNNILKISFVGDTSFTGIFYDKLLEGEEIFNLNILNQIKSTDYFICNLEGPATNKVNYLRSDINVVNPPNSIDYLKKRSINIFNLANNHVFDCGFEGFQDTLERLVSLDLLYFGAGKNIAEASKILYLKKNNIIVSLIGIGQNEGLLAGKNSEGIFSVNYFNLLKEKVYEASNNSDWVIVNYHGGEEYTLYPSPEKRKFLNKIASINGVNIKNGESNGFTN